MDQPLREDAATIEVERGLYGRRLLDGRNGARRLALVRGWMRPGARHSPHTHDVAETVLFLSGHGQLEIAGSARDVGPGDVVTIPPRVAHSTYNPGGEDLTFVAAFGGSHLAASPLATADAAGGSGRTGAVHRARHSIAAALIALARRLEGGREGV